jgi:hypothetical protein
LGEYGQQAEILSRQLDLMERQRIVSTLVKRKLRQARRATLSTSPGAITQALMPWRRSSRLIEPVSE